MKRTFIFCLLFIAVFASTAAAQWPDNGKLNAWTSRTISRRHDESREAAYLKEVRVGRNKGFDRVVFEFIGDIPRYQVEYVKAPIVGTADEEIKVAGRYFVEINLQLLPYPEPEQNIAEAIIPEGRLKFPAISEVKEIEWFEGVRPFVVGLKAKKLFRVQQLSNPTRLVIDFKH
jgi:hypothetical protein